MKKVLQPYDVVKFVHPLIVGEARTEQEVFLNKGDVVMVLFSVDEGDALQRFIGLFENMFIRVDAFPVEIQQIA